MKYFAAWVNESIFIINPGKDINNEITFDLNTCKRKCNLPNADILSFLRAFALFLEIYKNKEINDTLNKIDENTITKILEIISNYLISDKYPGETLD